MQRCKLDIQVQEPFRRLVKKKWLRKVALQAFGNGEVSAPCEIGLVIADHDTVRRLNRQYRHKNSSTDVLAFSLLEQRPKTKKFVPPPDGISRLGEVIVCYPQAEKQSQEYRHPVSQELALLVTHGVLHLLGYDHDQPEAAEAMKAKERQVMAQLEKTLAEQGS